jgi:hypothetical protein
MSFGGPGTGISGYSAQFTVGYTNSAGNINGYAPVAGNINGYAPVAGNINGYAPAAGQSNSLQLNQGGLGSTNWWWQGQGGTPGHLWGSNDGYNHYVYQYNQMYVGTTGYCNGNIGGYAPQCVNCGYAQSSFNAYSALQQGGSVGANAQLLGSMGFPKAGRAGQNGNYWGFYAGYNQQGRTSYANFNTDFGNYWGVNALPCVYQMNGGFNFQTCGQWQSSYQFIMYSENYNNSGWTWQVSG